jgi:iron(III) transport system ATP-binding protein
VSSLSVEELEVRYDERIVVSEVSFSIDDTMICLLGPSGCGKSTVLRTIAGFVKPSSGCVRIDDRVVASPEVALPPEERNVGMVFQDYALFPHLTASENIAFGIHGWSTRERRKRIGELLELVRMDGLKLAYPHELSGGEQQRVSLARALAPRPSILLMDEPFSSLDVELREQLASDIAQILRREQITAILVTHDQNEAFQMADDICVMESGRFRQRATAHDLYHHPDNRFVADFIGEGVMVPGRLNEQRRIETEFGFLDAVAPDGLTCGGSVEVLLRPDDVVLDAESSIEATVFERQFRGTLDLYRLETSTGQVLLSLLPSHHQFSVGAKIGVRLAPEHLVVFPTSGTRDQSS